MAVTLWVVAQEETGAGGGVRLSRGSRETVSLARALASTIEDGAEIVGVVLGAPGSVIDAVASELAGLGVSRVIRILDQSLASYTPGPYVDALARAVSREEPAFVVFPHTYRTIDFLARLGQRLSAALVPEVTSCELDDAGQLLWKRPILQGKILASVRVKASARLSLISVQGGAAPAAEGQSASAPIDSWSPDALRPADREIEGIEAAAREGVDLSAQEIVVAIGRGVGDADKLEPIRDLARVLGGEIGASRPVVDSGWLPRELQIGSSGQTVAPKLYFAIGISGAIQHLVGMRASQCVVAINKDASAPIFQLARYGLVGDLHELVPAITEALAKRS